jgi:hypothetical protein
MSNKKDAVLHIPLVKEVLLRKLRNRINELLLKGASQVNATGSVNKIYEQKVTVMAKYQWIIIGTYITNNFITVQFSQICEFSVVLLQSMYQSSPSTARS